MRGYQEMNGLIVIVGLAAFLIVFVELSLAASGGDWGKMLSGVLPVDGAVNAFAPVTRLVGQAMAAHG